MGSGWLVGETDCRTLVETNCVVMVEIGFVMVLLKWQHYQQTYKHESLGLFLGLECI